MCRGGCYSGQLGMTSKRQDLAHMGESFQASGSCCCGRAAVVRNVQPLRHVELCALPSIIVSTCTKQWHINQALKSQAFQQWQRVTKDDRADTMARDTTVSLQQEGGVCESILGQKAHGEENVNVPVTVLGCSAGSSFLLPSIISRHFSW